MAVADPQGEAAARLPTRKLEVGVSAVQFLTAGSLRLPGLAHGFLTRVGGVSQGVYASLNVGVGSADAPQAVTEDRARAAAALGIAPESLAVPYQVHSPDAIAIADAGRRTRTLAATACHGDVWPGARRDGRRLRHDFIRR